MRATTFSHGEPALRNASRPQSGESWLDESFLRTLSRLRLVTRRALPRGLGGMRRARRHGRGLDFADHRAYVPGDDIRHVDWHLFARHERPLVRLFEEESDLALYLMVDASASMAAGRPSKVKRAIEIAAALAHIGIAHLDRVSIDVVRAGLEKIDRTPGAAGGGSGRPFLDALARVRPAGTTDLVAAARAFIGRRSRRGVVVLLSDFFDPGGQEPALALLARHGFETVAICVHAPEEADPALSTDVDDALAVVDVETGTESRVLVNEALLDEYRRGYCARRDAFARHCRKLGTRAFFVSSAAPLENVIFRVLRGGLLL